MRRKVTAIGAAPYNHVEKAVHQIGRKRYFLSCGHHVDGDFIRWRRGVLCAPKSLNCPQCS